MNEYYTVVRVEDEEDEHNSCVHYLCKGCETAWTYPIDHELTEVDRIHLLHHAHSHEQEDVDE